MAEDTEGHMYMQVQKTGKTDGRNVHQEQWNKTLRNQELAQEDFWVRTVGTGKNVFVCLPCAFSPNICCDSQKFDGFLGLLSWSSVVIFIHLHSQCLSLDLLHSYDYKHLLKFPSETIASKRILSKLVNFLICPRSILLKLPIRPLSPQILQLCRIENSGLYFLMQALDTRRLPLHMCFFLNTIKTKSFFNK